MYYGEKKIEKPIRWAMVGGGKGSQIGYIHRSAAMRDFNFDLVAGAFDIDPERGREFGKQLHVDEDRCYPDYKTMFAKEAKRQDGIQGVSIATPNGTHFEITKAALLAGLHVVCEKPLCFTTEEAEELEALAAKQNKIVGVTYGYAGHQVIEEARQLIAEGMLGKIRIVNMQFSHGFHNVAVEKNTASTKWLVDPKVAGPSYVLGDVGTHPLYLSEVMLPDMKIKRLMCSRQSFVESRKPLEDNAMTIMEYDNGDFVPAGSVSAGDVLIDGNAIGDVGNVVLRDRKVLSEDGIFIVAITVNRREKRIISKAKVHTRGFVYVKKSRDILRESAEIVNQSVEEYLAQDSFDWGELKSAVRDSLAKYLFDQTKRRPAILPVVMEVR